jgi:hypothetical protein
MLRGSRTRCHQMSGRDVRVANRRRRNQCSRHGRYRSGRTRKIGTRSLCWWHRHPQRGPGRVMRQRLARASQRRRAGLTHCRSAGHRSGGMCDDRANRRRGGHGPRRSGKGTIHRTWHCCRGSGRRSERRLNGACAAANGRTQWAKPRSGRSGSGSGRGGFFAFRSVRGRRGRGLRGCQRTGSRGTRHDRRAARRKWGPCFVFKGCPYGRRERLPGSLQRFAAQTRCQDGGAAGLRGTGCLWRFRSQHGRGRHLGLRLGRCRNVLPPNFAQF